MQTLALQLVVVTLCNLHWWCYSLLQWCIIILYAHAYSNMHCVVVVHDCITYMVVVAVVLWYAFMACAQISYTVCGGAWCYTCTHMHAHLYHSEVYYCFENAIIIIVLSMLGSSRMAV